MRFSDARITAIVEEIEASAVTPLDVKVAKELSDFAHKFEKAISLARKIREAQGGVNSLGR